MEARKSALTVAGMALRAARDALPDSAQPEIGKKLTQPHLVCMSTPDRLGVNVQLFDVGLRLRFIHRWLSRIRQLL